MQTIAARSARYALRFAALLAVAALAGFVAVSASPSVSDASPLTITPKPRLVDQAALARLSGLPTLSAAPAVAIRAAHGEHDEDCALLSGRGARELVCRR
jgi:hypothetical protein